MHLSRKAARWALLLSIFVPFFVLLTVGTALADVPRASLKYKRDLIRIARYVWGLDAPIAVLAAQIQQESAWNKNARSTYASGLTQFTPLTVDWISKMHPHDLGEAAPLNPKWALRAQSIYMKQLYKSTKAATTCDRMWVALWAYNGGAGWVRRDQRLAKKNGADVRVALEVEPFNAGRAPAFFKENRDYPRKILLRWQPRYAVWGGVIECQTK